MKKLSLLPLFLGIFFLAAPAWGQSGSVKALRVVGTVQLVEDATGSAEALERGRIFGEGYTVITEAESNALLVFSNGATLRVAAESSISVNELIQETFSPELGSYQTLREEPTASESRLHLNYGEVTGQARLHEDSRFDVATNVGVAGIRGTRFQVSFTSEIDDDGRERMRMTVINIEGTVLVQSVDVTEIAEFSSVEPGTSASVDVDEETGTVTFSELSAEQAQQVMAIVEEMEQAIEEESDEVEPGTDDETEPEEDPADEDPPEEEDPLDTEEGDDTEDPGDASERDLPPDLERPGLSPSEVNE